MVSWKTAWKRNRRKKKGEDPPPVDWREELARTPKRCKERKARGGQTYSCIVCRQPTWWIRRIQRRWDLVAAYEVPACGFHPDERVAAAMIDRWEGKS